MKQPNSKRRDAKSNPISPLSSKGPLLARLQAYKKWILTLSVVIAAVAAIFGNINTIKEEIKKLLPRETPKPFPKDENTYNILLLPFEFYGTGEKSKFERALINRYRSMSEIENLNLVVRFENNTTEDLSPTRVREIGRELNANLVIFGSYEEDTGSEKGALLRYIDLDSLSGMFTKRRTQSFQSMLDIEDFKQQGLLQEDLNYIIYWTLGLQAYKQNKFHQALTNLEKIEAFQEIPEPEEVFFRLGVCYHMLGDKEMAKQYYEKMFAHNTTYEKAHLNYGSLMEDLGKYGLAKQHYVKALALKPDYPEAHNNLAILFYKLKEPGNAISHFERALEINSNNSKLRLNFGILLRYLREYQKAKKQFKYILEIDQNNAAAHNQLASLLYALKDYKNAKMHFNRALSLRPIDIYLHLEYVNFLEKIEGKEAVQDYYKTVLSGQLDNVNNDFLANLHLEYANFLKQIKEPEAAKRHYLEATKLKPNLGDKGEDDKFGIK